ncbi:tudor and KH domain-containing protein homolog isoform X2 [Halichondria panicea]|uniref:tudor and KH domain-containing protein homolog isoform X2 n=1 Tax=Halichondria panicea TaxID=6063 RepID=UPI00312B7A2F
MGLLNKVCPCVWVWRAWRRDPPVSGRADNSVKRVRQNVSVEFIVPESVVGYVIGRHGTSIRQVEEESGARVHFKDQQGSKDKVVVITGRPGCVASAKELIQASVDERLSSGKNQQTVTLTLPQRAVGKVIGRQGANIKSIQRESGAKVTMVTGGRNEAVRVCEVIGGPEEISRAVALIQEIVAAIDKPRPSRPTPPSHTQEGVSNIRDLELVISSDFIPVFVSSVDGHGGVWVQPIGLEDPVQLEGLVDEMTRYYGNTEDVYPGDVHVGDLFAASFDHDDKWYRVRVTCVSSGGVEVVYLDYGDYAAVNVRSLRPLRPEYCTLKAQAVRCLLDAIIPAGGVWSEGGLAALEDLTHSAAWRVVMAKVVTNTPTKIQLIDTSNNKDVDIAESLVSTGHAQWAKPHPPYPRSLRYHRDEQHPLLPITNQVVLNDQSDCSVAYVESPDLLFVIPIGYELLLSQLCARMNAVYDQSDDSISTLQRGDTVAAHLNTQWYRGHVISFNQSDCSALIRLVDYGVVVCLPSSQLKPLIDEFCEETVYSVPCALANIKPCGDGWSDEGRDSLRAVTNQGDWAVFSVKPTGCHSNTNGISIPTVVMQSPHKVGVSLNSDLVASGLAEEVKGRPPPEGREMCEGGEGVRQRNVRFRWSGAPQSVSVAGSFSDWTQLSLNQRGSGEFETAVDLPPGTHEYKYLVDGAWTHDSSQPTIDNDYGTLNNVLST